MSTEKWELSSGLTTHPSLLLAAASNDEWAWENMSRIYGPLVYEWLRIMRIPAHDAPDVCQNVFLNVFRKLTKFRENGGRFRSWLWGIAEHCAIDHYRQLKRAPDTLDPQDWEQFVNTLPTPIDAQDEDTPRGVHARALEFLSCRFEPSTLQMACLVILDRQSATEVSQALGVSRNTVYQNVSRVQRALREILNGLEF